MATLYRVGVDWSGTGVQGGGRSTHYFDAAAGTAQQAATAVATFWGAVDAFICSTARWDIDQEVSLIDSLTNTITDSDFVSAAGATGTDGSAMLPPATQGLIQWRTVIFVSGRVLRGRTYVPAPPEGQSEVTGIPSAAYVAALDAAGTALVSDASSALQVYSATHKVATDVSDVTVWNKWASLRTRRD